jgi:N-acylglucosamine-6-phosphate 2-epimerase
VACIEAGADVVAIDATARLRPDGLSLAEIVRRVRATSNVLLMADVAQLHEGEAAAALGFDLVSTTLAGYTETSPATTEPDFALVSALARRIAVPVIAEGRITTPAQAVEALRAGAWAVCVGKAITAPQFITGLFVQALQEALPAGERVPEGGWYGG